MILLFVTAAHAVPAESGCSVTSVTGTLPLPLADDVPIDVIPAAMLSVGDCGGDDWTGRLTETETGEEIAVASSADAPIYGLLEVDPGADLAPDTRYTLELSPAGGGGETTEVGFTTGEVPDAGLDGVPTVVSNASSYSEGDQVLSVTAEVTPAVYAGPSIIGFADADAPSTLFTTETAWDSASLSLSGRAIRSEAPDEVCVIARQRDQAGRWTDSDPVCDSPDVVREDKSHGCLDVTRGAPIGLVSVLLAAGLVRRRA
jgi:hypothetical protein